MLAVDLGTSWCKAALLDEAGRVLAGGRAYSRFGGPALAGADLERTWGAFVAAVREALAGGERAGLPAPAALAVACRGGNAVWLDDHGAAIKVAAAPLSRESDEVAEVYAAPVWGPEGPFAFAYAPLTIGRSLWLRRHDPAAWARVARAGLLHDWLMRRLTGRWVTDPASGPGYHDWPAAAVALAGLPPGALPVVVPPEAIAGPLDPAAAAALGLPAATPVACGCHDGVAANLGAAVVEPGDSCVTLGSNLVLRVVTSARVSDCFGYPITARRWAWVRGAHGIAAQIDTIVDALDGQGLPVARERHDALTRLAGAAPIGCDGLRLPMLPRGAEERQRELAAAALRAGASPGAVYRAGLEGAAQAIRGLLEVARGEGALPARYVVTGAMATNALFLQILSGVLSAPLEVADAEAGLRGAAILAAVAAGWHPDVETAVARMTARGERVAAASAVVDAYQNLLGGQALGRGAAPGRH